MSNNDNKFTKLMRAFKIGKNKNQDVEDKRKVRPLSNNGKPEKWNSRVEDLYNRFLSDNYLYLEDYKTIKEVWEDQDILYYNNPYFSRAMKTIVDEVLQVDLGNTAIGIEGSSKIKDELRRFHDKVRVDYKLPSITTDIVKYGNAGCILSSENDNEIDDLLQIDIYDLIQVLQFTPYEIEKKIQNRDAFLHDYMQIDRVDKLVKSITNKDNYSSYYKDYLLGYRVADTIIPPWRFLHFKNRTSGSPFKPYGLPEYIHGVAPHKQYDSALTLQVLARGARIPIEKYEINAPNIVDPMSKIEFITEFINQIQNSGFGTSRKEEKGIGEIIFTIKDLFEYSMEVPDIDIGKIDDIELLINAIIVATELPRNLIDPNDSGFGDSGVALIQKFKPFARKVYKYQSIILEQITQMDKIHLMQSEKFSQDEIKFLLTMPYPESQIDGDLISNQQDLISLSNDIIELISDKFLNSEPLPSELVKNIMQQVLPYDDSKIDQWVKMAKDGQNENLNNDMYETYNKIVKKDKRALQESIKSIVMDTKISKIREGKIGSKHCFSSVNRSGSFDSERLREWLEDELNLESNILREELEFNTKKYNI